MHFLLIVDVTLITTWNFFHSWIFLPVYVICGMQSCSHRHLYNIDKVLKLVSDSYVDGYLALIDSARPVCSLYTPPPPLPLP
jgi:hypothetical protein